MVYLSIDLFIYFLLYIYIYIHIYNANQLYLNLHIYLKDKYIKHICTYVQIHVHLLSLLRYKIICIQQAISRNTGTSCI